MWHAVVPLKGWGTSKSRLALPDAVRREVVQAMAQDTFDALMECPEVQTISVLVRERELLRSAQLRGVGSVVVQADPAASLNSALRWFARSRVDQQQPLVVVVADLPALQGRSLSAVLAQAQRHSCTAVADRAGSGTTVLTALVATDLDPHFGANSAEAHRAAGAAMLVGPPDLCCDVDTLADLSHARTLGLGQCTAALVADPATAAWLG